MHRRLVFHAREQDCDPHAFRSADRTFSRIFNRSLNFEILRGRRKDDEILATSQTRQKVYRVAAGCQAGADKLVQISLSLRDLPRGP